MAPHSTSVKRTIVDVQGAWGTLTFTLDCGHLAKHQTYSTPTKTAEEHREKQEAFRAHYLSQPWLCLACPQEKTRRQLRAALAKLDKELAAYEPPQVPAAGTAALMATASGAPPTQENRRGESDLAGGRRRQSRTVSTRPITFPCAWCHRDVTEERFPGQTPRYCRRCKHEATRAKTRARVAAWRTAHPDARRTTKTM